MLKLTRLCAWCRCLIDDDGQPGRELSVDEIVKLKGAISHGCCQVCRTTLIQPQIEVCKQTKEASL